MPYEKWLGVARLYDVFQGAESIERGCNGTGNRLLAVSSHNSYGPVRTRMPWRGQIES